MQRMKNVEVVRNFVNGDTDCRNHSNSLRIEGDKLVNYSTVIAQWTRHGLTLNDTKYSNTTSRIQNYFRIFATHYHTVSNIYTGCQDLEIFVEAKYVEVIE